MIWRIWADDVLCPPIEASSFDVAYQIARHEYPAADERGQLQVYRAEAIAELAASSAEPSLTDLIEGALAESWPESLTIDMLIERLGGEWTGADRRMVAMTATNLFSDKRIDRVARGTYQALRRKRQAA